MFCTRTRIFAALAALVMASGSFAQSPASKETPAAKETPVGKGKVVVSVNGREIYDLAVERALKPIPKESHEKARPDVLKFLVENALIDNYLELLKVNIPDADVDKQLNTFKEEVKKQGQEYDKILTKMEITETDLRKEIYNQLRWDKFASQQINEDRLKKFFEASPELFDGTTVHARHILINAEGDDKKVREEALAKIKAIKDTLTKEIATGAAKVPDAEDKLARQKQLNKVSEEAFAEAAKKDSNCPSKRDGGDLGEFPRIGAMVEPFSKAAFDLKPYQVSEPVATQFGYHLIMVVGRKQGNAVKFDTVRPAVYEAYNTQLRDAVLKKMKEDPNTKIIYAK
jgi:parvulin-like peptidyl-prolyl isomerase